MKFYRFPECVTNLNLGDSIQKIKEEVDEVALVFDDYYHNLNINAMKVQLGMELMDVIHATETMLRKNFTDEELEYFQTMVVEKNRQRGYYDKGVEDGNDVSV